MLNMNTNVIKGNIQRCVTLGVDGVHWDAQLAVCELVRLVAKPHIVICSSTDFVYLLTPRTCPDPCQDQRHSIDDALWGRVAVALKACSHNELSNLDQWLFTTMTHVKGMMSCTADVSEVLRVVLRLHPEQLRPFLEVLRCFDASQIAPLQHRVHQLCARPKDLNFDVPRRYQERASPRVIAQVRKSGVDLLKLEQALQRFVSETLENFEPDPAHCLWVCECACLYNWFVS